MMETLRRFNVGEPIKSLFKPIFTLRVDGELPAVRLECLAPDSLGSGREVSIVLERIPMPYQAANVTTAAHFLRGMIHEMLMHEADEAITVDGVRVFDPHKYEVMR